MTLAKYKKINMLPDKDNPHIKRVISLLNIAEPPIYVDVIPDRKAVPGQCFPNVLTKVSLEGGEMVVGWQFCEYSYMIEAQFHGIWQSPEGLLIDVTPGDKTEMEKILFVIDRSKQFDGTRTDNFRFNTTQNELVDDSIELLKKKFRFEEKVERVDDSGRLQMNEAEEKIYQKLSFYFDHVEKLLARNSTIHAPCFCGSGRKYKDCHRKPLLQFLRTI